jgi:hypothetical protein
MEALYKNKTSELVDLMEGRVFVSDGHTNLNEMQMTILTYIKLVL